MRYLERLKQRATNISVLSPNTASSHLLAHVVLEEDLLDLGGDHVGVQAAGQGRHLIQTRRRCQEIQMKFRTRLVRNRSGQTMWRWKDLIKRMKFALLKLFKKSLI